MLRIHSSQIADGRTLEATFRGANDILKAILPSTAVEQREGYLNDRPAPPFPSTSNSFNPSAASFSPASAISTTAPCIEPDLGHTPSTRPDTPSFTGAVSDWKPLSVAEWSSPASTFAPSEAPIASRSSLEKPAPPAQIDVETSKKPDLQGLPKDQALSGDAWLAGETVKTPTKADIHKKSEEKPTEQPQSPKWNIAAPSFTPLSLAVSASKVAAREAENKVDDSGVWLSRSPKSKAMPIHPAPKSTVAPSLASPSPPIQEHIDASAGKGGFVSAQSLRESRSPPPSPTLSEASTITIPRSLPLKSSAKAFVPSSYPDPSAAAFWAGQAMAMAQYGMPLINMLQQQGHMPTLMVQNNLNPQANTYQPGSYGTSLASRTDLNIGAKAFIPSAPNFDKPFPYELESYSELFVKAGVESIADLKEMLDTPELGNEFVDGLRKEYPHDITTFKAAFKLKVQLKKILKLQ